MRLPLAGLNHCEMAGKRSDFLRVELSYADLGLRPRRTAARRVKRPVDMAGGVHADGRMTMDTKDFCCRVVTRLARLRRHHLSMLSSAD